MKDEALKLATELDVASSEMEYNHVVDDWKLLSDSAYMIRRLVEELDKAYSDGEICGSCGAIRYDPICEKPQTKPLSNDEIADALKNVNMFDMKAKMAYREIEFPAYDLTLRFIRDDNDKTRYVGYTTDEELDKFEKQIEERHGIK